MRTICYSVLCVHALLIAAGCGPSDAPLTNPPAPTALSFEDWNKLPIPEKYDEATFERLRMGNPLLKSERAWKAYLAKEVMPLRKKEIPMTTVFQ